MGGIGSVLVDTSTLNSLNLDRFSDRDTQRLFSGDSAGALEALVLFDRILLDGPSIRRNLQHNAWLLDIDSGVKIVEATDDDQRTIYGRAASMIENIDWPSARDVSFGHHIHEATASELGLRFRPSASWNEVARTLRMIGLEEVLDAFRRVSNEFQPTRGGALLRLIRLFYYLALQEKLSCTLLLHPTKSYVPPDGDPTSHATSSTSGTLFEVAPHRYAKNIFSVFDERVRHAYLERRRQWLGESVPEIPLPPLSRFISKEAARRGWSVGRTISWLRQQPEVQSFRKGMGMLVDAVTDEDHERVSSILAELDLASAEWSKRGGHVTQRSRLSLQVALPFLSPTIDIPVALPARSSAQRMLVLIKKLVAGI